MTNRLSPEEQEWENEGSGVVAALALADVDTLYQLRKIVERESLTDKQRRKRVFELEEHKQLPVAPEFVATHGKRIPWQDLIEQALKPTPPSEI